MSGNKKIKYLIAATILITLLIAAAFMGYLWTIQQSVITDGDVFMGYVRIADERYEYTYFVTKGRTKKIAEIDNWKIYEVSEDPNHIFLKMKSFTGEYYIVREDYQIPTEGKVSCAYVERRRIDDEKTLEALTDILSRKYDAGTAYYFSHKVEEQEWNYVVVGYEDCPVGTDHSIYAIGKIDSKWVVVFYDEVGEWEDGRLPAIYHDLDEKYYELFERNKIWSR